MFCGKCGSNVDGMRFCGVCGAPVNDGNGAEAVASPQETSPSPQAASQVPVGFGEFQAVSYAPDAQQANAAQFAVAGAVPNANGVVAKPPLSSKAKLIRIAIGAVLAAAVVVAALFMMGILPPSTPIDAKNFPNAVIRNALLNQVDTDGNGRLSSEEASSITALVYTKDGVMFLMNGMQVDVDEVSDVLASQAQEHPEQAQLVAGETVMPDMDVFPNISTVVITDSNIETIDTTLIPEAEYVDLRGSKIKSLDLSKNVNLTTLFCDPDVQLYGLEEAGLYFTDLITQITHSSSDSNLTVEYDSMGRPITLTKYGNRGTFTYDDQGRLVHISDDAYGHDISYQYASNGLMESYSYTGAMDVTETLRTVRFGYDGNAELTQIAEDGLETPVEALAYEDGHLASAKSVMRSTSSSSATSKTEFVKYQYDDAGRMTTDFSGMYPKMDEDPDYSNTYFYQGADQYAYNDLGQVTTVVSETDLTRSATAGYKTEFSTSPEGFPEKTSVTMQGRGSSSTYTQSYTCNSDGYIVSAKVESPGSSSSNVEEVSYVKMVGSLEDRPSRRFVPVLRVSIVPGAISESYRTPVQYLQSTDCIRGDWWPFDVLLMQPQCALMSHLNIVPNYLFNPNELKLARYDEDHWRDGLDLTVGALPIKDEAIQAALEASAAAEIPANPTSFLNDQVYGSVVGEYMAFARYIGDMTDSARKSALYSSSGIESKFPKVAEQFFLSNNYYSDDSFNYCFSYVDLNADGTNELAVGLSYGHYPTQILALYANDNGTPKLLAESAYRDWYELSTKNCIVESASGGFDVHRSAAYTIEGAQLKQVGLYEFDYVDSNDRGSDNSLYKLSFQVDGGEVQHLTVPLSQINAYGEQFRAAYPSGVCQWTCLW